LCEEDLDSLPHFLFDCQHPACLKMRRKISRTLIRYVGASALQARLVPSWSKLIFSMRDNAELTDTDKRECQNTLFGLVKIEEGLLQKLDKEAKQKLLSAFKHTANEVRKGWAQRCKYVHNPNYI
jgi:hypothetical protein